MLSRSHTPAFPADALIFLGDGLRDLSYLSDSGIPLFPVMGNCDLMSFGAPIEDTLTLDGVRIFFSHGDRFSVKSGVERIAAYAAERSADVVLYGHTHLPLEQYLRVGTKVGDRTLEKPLHILNPGSIGESRDGFGCGYGVLTIQNGTVLWRRVSL